MNRLSSPVRQRGLSALLMVLILLMAGTLILNGLQQQSSDHLRNTQSEITAIQQFSTALSAQAWGAGSHWQPQAHWQCQPFTGQPPGRVCLRLEATSGNPPVVVLAAHALNPDPIILWRWGYWTDQRPQFSRHGWSDFCPLTPESLCDLP